MEFRNLISYVYREPFCISLSSLLVDIDCLFRALFSDAINIIFYFMLFHIYFTAVSLSLSAVGEQQIEASRITGFFQKYFTELQRKLRGRDLHFLHFHHVAYTQIHITEEINKNTRNHISMRRTWRTTGRSPTSLSSPRWSSDWYQDGLSVTCRRTIWCHLNSRRIGESIQLRQRCSG